MKSFSTPWVLSFALLACSSGGASERGSGGTIVSETGALSVGWAHPLRAKPLGLEVEVGADLVFEVGLRSTADHQVFSGVGPGSITRAMESTRRFQRPVSKVSCLCPVAVSE